MAGEIVAPSRGRFVLSLGKKHAIHTGKCGNIHGTSCLDLDLGDFARRRFLQLGFLL
jgi:hypothetical protein